MTSLYLPVVTSKDVRAAVKTTIATWINYYTQEISRQTGTTLPAIRSYGVDITTLPDGTVADELPAVRVTCPGVLGEPELRGDGSYDATWAVGVGVVVAGPTSTPATDLADLYVAALRALLVQQGGLGGFATSTAWLDEEVTPIAFERDRVVAAGTLMFSVRVTGVVNRFGGPTAPPADPDTPVDAVEVTTTSLTVTATAP